MVPFKREKKNLYSYLMPYFEFEKENVLIAKRILYVVYDHSIWNPCPKVTQMFCKEAKLEHSQGRDPPSLAESQWPIKT